MMPPTPDGSKTLPVPTELIQAAWQFQLPDTNNSRYLEAELIVAAAAVGLDRLSHHPFAPMRTHGGWLPWETGVPMAHQAATGKSLPLS